MGLLLGGGGEKSSFHLFLVCEGASAQQSSLILQHMRLALSPSRSSITPMANASSIFWSQTRERDATRLNGGTGIAAVFCASDTFKFQIAFSDSLMRRVASARWCGRQLYEPAFSRGGCETAFELYRAKGDFRMIGLGKAQKGYP